MSWHLPDDLRDDELSRAWLREQGFTDGLPVIVPTAARLEAALRAAGLSPDAPLGMMAPFNTPYSARDLMAQLIMAGAEPRHLPPVQAALQALCDPAFNLLGILTTTGNAAPLVMFSEQAADRFGLHKAGNTLGPSYPNAAIGRAIALALRNLAGRGRKGLDMASIGQPAKFTCCGAENATAGPWPSTLDRPGGDRGAVLVAPISGLLEIADDLDVHGECLVETFARVIQGSHVVGASSPQQPKSHVLLLTPEHAHRLDRAGYTPERLAATLAERCVFRVADLTADIRRHFERQGWTEPVYPILTGPDMLKIVVTGGPGIKSAYCRPWDAAATAVVAAV